MAPASNATFVLRPRLVKSDALASPRFSAETKPRAPKAIFLPSKLAAQVVVLIVYVGNIQHA
jgi:hypothetical protein